MTGPKPPDYRDLVRKYLAAQLAGDRREALRLITEEGLERGATVVDLHHRVIRAAQLEIGLLWERNRISIAQEHLATGISQLAMAHIYQLSSPVEANERVVAVACVEGEQHELPARLVADYLDFGGFTVHYLGANVPTDELVKLSRNGSLDLVVLSATMSFHTGALREAVSRLRAELGETLPILVGGHVLEWEPDLINELAVNTAPSDPKGLVEVARALTGVA